MKAVIRAIRFCGVNTFVACDGLCTKAWGLNGRPGRNDDRVGLPDDELGEAPADPGTYEGGEGKPAAPPVEGERFSRWCVRECERNVTADYNDRTEAAVRAALVHRVAKLTGKTLEE